MRGEVKFDSKEALVAALEADQGALGLLASSTKPGGMTWQGWQVGLLLVAMTTCTWLGDKPVGRASPAWVQAPLGSTT